MHIIQFQSAYSNICIEHQLHYASQMHANIFFFWNWPFNILVLSCNTSCGSHSLVLKKILPD